MTIGLLFWILMIIWLIFGIYTSWPDWRNNGPYHAGGTLLLFILLFLLGWHDFGFPIHG